MATPADICCSFCGKRRDEVQGVVAGARLGVIICNECVDLCVEIFAEQREDREQHRRESPGAGGPS